MNENEALERLLVALKEHKDEILSFQEKTIKAVDKLDTARTTFENSTKKWWVEILKPVITGILMFMVALMCLILLVNSVGDKCDEIEVGGITFVCKTTSTEISPTPSSTN